jgi:putative aldouronate transport system permease protein
MEFMDTMTKLVKEIIRNKYIYILLLPAALFYLLFSYMPMYGIQIAFKEYVFVKGFFGSPWNNFEHFKTLFIDNDFWIAFRNTVTISISKLVFFI